MDANELSKSSVAPVLGESCALQMELGHGEVSRTASQRRWHPGWVQKGEWKLALLVGGSLQGPYARQMTRTARQTDNKHRQKHSWLLTVHAAMVASCRRLHLNGTAHAATAQPASGQKPPD